MTFREAIHSLHTNSTVGVRRPNWRKTEIRLSTRGLELYITNDDGEHWYSYSPHVLEVLANDWELVFDKK